MVECEQSAKDVSRRSKSPPTNPSPASPQHEARNFRRHGQCDRKLCCTSSARQAVSTSKPCPSKRFVRPAEHVLFPSHQHSSSRVTSPQAFSSINCCFDVGYTNTPHYGSHGVLWRRRSQVSSEQVHLHCRTQALLVPPVGHFAGSGLLHRSPCPALPCQPARPRQPTRCPALMQP